MIYLLLGIIVMVVVLEIINIILYSYYSTKSINKLSNELEKEFMMEEKK